MVDLVQSVNEGQLKTGLPELAPGDTVRVHVRVVEGSRERLQAFEGVVMRMRRGREINGNFTVRRVTNNVGVERTFLLHSPEIEKIEVLRHAVVRRAQLYFLRGRSGKRARLKEKRAPKPTK